MKIQPGSKRTETQVLNDASDNSQGSLAIYNKDRAGRIAYNSIFGESIVASRIDQFNSMFIYPPDSWKLEQITENGGTITQSNSMLVLDTSSASNGKALASSRRGLKYIPGHQAQAEATAIFTPGLTGGVKQHFGMFDDLNGFSIGMDNDIFSVFYRRNGIDNTPIHQTDFNIDKLDGSGISGFKIDPSKGNVYRISFGYLGFAPIIFEVLAGTELNWVPFHSIDYPNKFEEPHITLPYLKIRAEVINSGNTTPAILKTASISTSTIGIDSKPVSSRDNAVKLSTTFADGTDEIVIVFHNKDTFGGIENRIETTLKIVTAAIESNKPVVITRYKLKNAPTGGTWTSVNATESIMEYSVDTTIDLTDAKLTFPIAVDKVGQFFKDFSGGSEYRMLPDEYVAYTITTAAGGGGDIVLGVSWDELF